MEWRKGEAGRETEEAWNKRTGEEEEEEREERKMQWIQREKGQGKNTEERRGGGEEEGKKEGKGKTVEGNTDFRQQQNTWWHKAPLHASISFSPHSLQISFWITFFMSYVWLHSKSFLSLTVLFLPVWLCFPPHHCEFWLVRETGFTLIIVRLTCSYFTMLNAVFFSSNDFLIWKDSRGKGGKKRFENEVFCQES